MNETVCNRVWRAVLGAASGLFLLAGCASDELGDEFAVEEPETGIEYTPLVTGAPSEEIQALMEQSLLIFRRVEQGAQSPAFLRRRADGDIATAQKILRSFGYYGATVEARVETIGPDASSAAASDDPEPSASAGGQAASETPDPGETAESEDQPKPLAIAEIAIDAGDAFVLARHDIVLIETGEAGAPDLAPPETFGSPIGGAAAASAILNSERAMVASLRQSGRPYAENRGRSALADRDAQTIEVETTIATGPRVRYGPISFTGAPNVDDEYLLTYLPWTEGDEVNSARLSEFQRALMSTELFRAGRVELPEEPPEGDVAPITVTLEEAPFQTVKAGVRFNTDEGPGVRLGYEHRNLFGANEQVETTLDVSFDEQVLSNEFRKPQFFRPEQDFVAGLELRRIDDDAFEELGGTITAGIERKLGPKWTVGAGGLLEFSSITDEGETDDAFLGGLPLFAAYDGSDDLLDPTDGERIRFDVTPFGGSFSGEAVAFLRLDMTASIYRPLDSEGDVVIAGRGRLGSIPSGSLDDVPQTRRLYSGGGGSVRGFEEDFVGPLDDAGDPIGGRSVIEFGGEIRGKVIGDLALAAFVEAGSVSTDVVPSFEEDLLIGAGGGIRYHSPIGPIRLDVAVPVNPRAADESFQVYISIGQAF